MSCTFGECPGVLRSVQKYWGVSWSFGECPGVWGECPGVFGECPGVIGSVGEFGRASWSFGERPGIVGSVMEFLGVVVGSQAMDKVNYHIFIFSRASDYSELNTTILEVERIHRYLLSLYYWISQLYAFNA